jgi:serine/threonine protein kinase
MPSIETGAELILERDSFPLDRYKPLYELGFGASGVVYLALDRVLNKKVAIKILRSVSPEIVIAFQKEARTTSKLKHRYIIDLLDFGVTEGGAPYMVLEFILGPSLDDVIRDTGPLKLRDFYSVFSKTCGALAYAHGNNVFHRDLKPANILLTGGIDGDFEIRVIDFGLAKILSDSADQSSNKQFTIVGTPLYMSPDQGLGRTFDARSEVYSLGCVMYEAISGQPPFKADSALELLSLHAETSPPRLADSLTASGFSSAERNIPKSVENIIRKCLAKNPIDRYQSIAEVREDLEESENQDHFTVPDEGKTRSSIAVTGSQPSLSWILSCVTLLGLLGALVFYIIATNNVGTQTENASPVKDVDNMLLNNAPLRKSGDTLNPYATVIRLNGALSEDELKDIGIYKYATEIDLSNNIHSDEVIDRIRSPYLQTLKLNNTPVRTLEPVTRLKSLRRLLIASTGVDSAAIKRLAALPNLVEVDLRNVEIGDDGFESLANIKPLQLLTFRSSDFSLKSIRKVHEALPACLMRINDDRLKQSAEAISIINNRAVIPVISAQSRTSDGKFQETQSLLKEAVSFIEKKQGKDAPVIAEYEFTLGANCIAQKKYSEAKPYLVRSIAVAEKTGYTNCLPDAYQGLVHCADALKDRLAGDAIAERGIGAIKAGEGFTLRYGHFANRVAEHYLYEKNFSKARYWYDQVKACKENLELRSLSSDSLDYVHFVGPFLVHYGELCLAEGKQDEGKENLKKAEKILLPHLADSLACKELMTATCLTLANLAQKEKRFDEAVQYQRRGLELAEDIEHQDVPQIKSDLQRFIKAEGEGRAAVAK